MNTATHARPHKTDADCCHAPAQQDAHTPQDHCTGKPQAAHAGHAHGSGWGAAASVTLHCLTGCAIGEWIGLTIGVTLGLQTMHTVTLAVVLAYVSGFALTLVPLLRGGLRFAQAFKIVWVGEAISIAAMEIVMNLVDYHMGGMRRGMSLLHAQYWIAFSAAAVAGYFAAWPVNKWMLGRNMKKCH